MFYYVILILIIVALGVIIIKLSNDKKEEEKEVVLIGKEKDEYAELGRGLAEYNQKLHVKRELAKTKILEMFKANSSTPFDTAQGGASGQAPEKKISNKEVAKALNISVATARRYLDDLESEKKIKQLGKTGKKVIYTLISG